MRIPASLTFVLIAQFSAALAAEDPLMKQAQATFGINVGGQMYAPFGVVEKPGADILPPADKSRLVVTHTASDEYVFRVPSLRNVELTPPYFHSGRS